ncbi:hypothetical protein [Curtobacterium sp. MCSS17_005]|uniref:hypothetical protein n=1 Tax=Curtobacterium sp. MCSS17_005 TaxID=2175641 RepID=UPI000DA9F43D|nr:hypothetical protein [Curtobacterium sp. MCSS17_005]WIB34181.1 hypothetical protein DEJ20_06890 [Curtobacterium sp. MCSS17_005]
MLDGNQQHIAGILDFVRRMVAHDQVVDIGGDDGVGDAVSNVSRSCAHLQIARPEPGIVVLDLR